MARMEPSAKEKDGRNRGAFLSRRLGDSSDIIIIPSLQRYTESHAYSLTPFPYRRVCSLRPRLRFRRQRRLLPLHHPVRHEVAVEGAVHALQRDDLANGLPPDPGAGFDHRPGVVHPDPDGGHDRIVSFTQFAEPTEAIAPVPSISRTYSSRETEVRVRPLLVQKLQILLLLPR